jgi:hypothetical protein
MQSTTNRQLFTEITTEEASAINGGRFNPGRFINGVRQVANGISNIFNSFR